MALTQSLGPDGYRQDILWENLWVSPEVQKRKRRMTNLIVLLLLLFGSSLVLVRRGARFFSRSCVISNPRASRLQHLRCTGCNT